MEPVETVFLDAGGVLVHPNWKRIAAHFTANGSPVDPAHLAAAELRAARDLDTPEHFHASNDSSRWFTFLDLVFRHAGVALGPGVLERNLAELKRQHDTDNLWESVPDEILPALDRLRAAGYRLVVVSNANGTVREKLRRVGIAEKVDLVLDSHEEGVEKPDPRLFHIALERSKSKARTTIHVGDLYHIDVVGARAAGIRAVLMDRGGHHAGRDCPRVPSLEALVDALKTGGL